MEIEFLHGIIWLLVFACLFSTILNVITKFDYNVRTTDLIITWHVLGLIPVKKIVALDEIIAVQPVSSLWELRKVLTLRDYPQIWGKIGKHMVCLKLRRRFFNVLVISPKDVEVFIQEVRMRMPRSQGIGRENTGQF